jgi:hypothetical protein
MKKLVKMLSVFALSLMIGLCACSDDSEPEACENGTFQMTVNGEQLSGNSFNSTLLKSNSGGVDGKRMDIRATDAEGRQVIITFNDLTTGTSGNGVSTDEYIPFEEVVTGSENTFLFTIIEDGASYFFISGELDITSCDANAKKVSGTFSFSDGDFEVTNGTFTNMCYSILQ